MKKLMMALLVGMLLCPMAMDAKQYVIKQGADFPKIPKRSPALFDVTASVDSQTGYLYVSANNDITGLTITISQGSIVYEDATISLSAGQTYTTSMADYDEGDYTLTLENSDGDTIGLYTITVEDD